MGGKERAPQFPQLAIASPSSISPIGDCIASIMGDWIANIMGDWIANAISSRIRVDEFIEMGFLS